eukprot:TRINITY_DN360_c0_g2_i1.p1 TRINITY_DN360_c0_g2~~TRINITY_DN360_c0_g2_i1.p1  ORF type:complete len:4395 (-),score=487.31 TRINITY_DN360_c0_g2_i1:145-13329(-)
MMTPCGDCSKMIRALVVLLVCSLTCVSSQVALNLDRVGTCNIGTCSMADRANTSASNIMLVQRRAGISLGPAAHLLSISRFQGSSAHKRLHTLLRENASYTTQRAAKRHFASLSKALGETAFIDDVWNAITNVADSIVKAVTGFFEDIFGSFVKLIELLFDKLKDFDQCLPVKFKIEGLIRFMTDRSGQDFGKIIVDFYEGYIGPPIESGLEWFEYQTRQGFVKHERTVSSQGNDVEEYKEDDVEWLFQIIDNIWNSMVDLFSRPGYEAAGCFQKHLIQPFIEPLKEPSRVLISFAVSKITELVGDPMEQLTDWLGSAMAFVMGELDWIDENMVSFTRGAASRACTVVLNATQTRVDRAISQAEGGYIDNATIQELYQELVSEMPSDMIATVAAEGLGFLLSLFFEWCTEHLVAPLLEFAASAIGSSLSWLLHWVNGAFGTVPEVGGAVSALATSASQAVAEFWQNGFVTTGKVVVKAGLDAVRKLVSDIVKESFEEALEADSGVLTWIRPVIVVSTKLVQKALPSLDEDITRCQASRKSVAGMLQSVTFGDDPASIIRETMGGCSSASCSRSSRDYLLALSVRRRRRTHEAKYVARLPRLKESTACFDVSFDGRVSNMAGRYCPIAKDGKQEFVYLHDGMNQEDTYHFSKEHESGQLCNQGDWSFRRIDPEADFLDADGSFVELNGPVMACWNATQQVRQTDGKSTSLVVNLNDRLFGIAADEGETITPVRSLVGVDSSLRAHFALSPSTCNALNISVDQTSSEFGASIIVLDDPSTIDVENDYTIHPCDCFPESWGVEPPVLSESFNAVPAGSANKFFPGSMFLSQGGATCGESDLIVELPLLDEDICKMRCKSLSCKYYFFGPYADGQVTCRLYSKCTDLVLLTGLQGDLHALSYGERRYCHVANPEACALITQRRDWLTRDFKSAKIRSCWQGDLLLRCDYYRLLGAELKCGDCQYMRTDAKQTEWEMKKHLPNSFANGEVVGAQCWSERYAGSTQEGTSLKCIHGAWVSESGKSGLDGFECFKCLQVAGVSYKSLMQAKKQALYFVDRFQVQVRVYTSSKSPMCLKSSFPDKERSTSFTACDKDGSTQEGSVFFLEKASPSSSSKLRRLRVDGNIEVADMCLSARLPDASYPGFASCLSGQKGKPQHFTLPELADVFQEMMNKVLSYEDIRTTQPHEKDAYYFTRSLMPVADCTLRDNVSSIGTVLTGFHMSGNLPGGRDKFHSLCGFTTFRNLEQKSDSKHVSKKETVCKVTDKEKCNMFDKFQAGNLPKVVKCADGTLLRKLSYQLSEKELTETSGTKEKRLYARAEFLCRRVSTTSNCFKLYSDRREARYVTASVQCPSGHGLQGVEWRTSKTESGTLADAAFTCCKLGGVTFSIDPISLGESSIDPREGLYCPSARSFGRLSYQKVMPIGVQGSAAGSIEYDSWAGQWCIGGLSKQCVDFPKDWADVEHSNCSKYEAKTWCTKDGLPGSGWRTTFGSFKDYAVDGMDATSACCACGGGRQTKYCFAGQPTVSPQHIKASGDTDPLEFVEITDFEGVVEDEAAAMAMEGAGADGSEILPPTQVTFNSPGAQYSKECKDELFYDPKKTADYGLTQPLEEWKKNPCSQVAGKDGEWTEPWGRSYLPFEVGGVKQKRENKDQWRGGVEYKTVMDCRTREEDRDDESDQYGELAIRNGFAVSFPLKFLKIPFNLPEVTVTAAGVGSSFGIGDIFQLGIDLATTISETLAEALETQAQANNVQDATNDCKSFNVGFSRLFCDMYCVMNVVRTGSTTVSDSIELATKLTNDNLFKLADYSVASVASKIDDIASKVASAAPSAQLIERDSRQVQAKVLSLFDELRDMSSTSTYSPAGVASALRASHEYVDQIRFMFEQANESYAIDDIAGRVHKFAGLLHAKVSSAQHMPRETARVTSASVAMSVSDAAKSVERTLRQRVSNLGNWRYVQKNHRDLRQLASQRDGVSSEMERASILVEFDDVLWRAHYAVDRYLDAAEEQHSAYSDALAMLQGYQNCQHDFKALSKAYSVAQAKTEVAQTILGETWSNVLGQFSVLASIADAHLFELIAEEDAALVTVDAWRDALTKSTSLENGSSTCQFNTVVGTQALVTLLSRRLADGAFGNAVLQIREVIANIADLRERRAREGVRVTVSEENDFKYAGQRLTNAIRAVTHESSAVVRELRLRLLPTACDFVNERGSDGEQVLLQDENHYASINAILSRLRKRVNEERVLEAEVAELYMRKRRLESPSTKPAGVSNAPISFVQAAITRESSTNDGRPGVHPSNAKQGVGLHEVLEAKRVGLFEQCSVSDHQRARVGSTLTEALTGVQAPSLDYACGSEKKRCTCTSDEMLLELVDVKLGSLVQSCCPINSKLCAGCALFHAGRCQQCLGGFVMSGSGECNACMDAVGWSDRDNRQCDAYGGRSGSLVKSAAPRCNASTKNVVHKGLSAMDACCACGGGVSVATPFMYEVRASVLGAPVVGRPVPRTASSYALNAGCTLAKYGLTFEAATGTLQGIATSPEPFDVQCTVIALQGTLREKATLSVSVKANFNYPQYVFFDKQTAFYAPARQDTSNSYLFSLSCSPALPWLTIDSDSGALNAVEPGSFSSGLLSGIADVAVASGGRCFIHASTKAGDALPGSAVVVVWPKYWSNISYKVQSLSLVGGDKVPELKPLTDAVPAGVVPPTGFSIHCDAGNNTFSYDAFGKVAYINGKEVFTFDPERAAFGGVVSNDIFVGLSATTERSGVLLVRDYLKMKCLVVGVGVSRDSVVSAGSLEIKVSDSSAWAEGKLSTGVFDASYATTVSATSERGCRDACKRREDCSHYSWKEKPQKKCAISTASIRRRRSEAKTVELRKESPRPVGQQLHRETSARGSTAVAASVAAAYAEHVAHRKAALNDFASFEVPWHATKTVTLSRQKTALLQQYKIIHKATSGWGKNVSKAEALQRIDTAVTRARSQVNSSRASAHLGNWFGEVAEFLKAAERLGKMLTGTIDCLNSVPDEKYHIDNIIKFGVERFHDPARLVDEGMKEYIQPFIDGAVAWSQKRTSEAIDAGMGEFEADAMAKVRKHRVEGSTNDHWILKMADDSFNLLLDLVGQPNMEASACLVTHLVRPGYISIRGEIRKVLSTFLAPMIDFFAGILDEVIFVAGEVVLALSQGSDWLKKLKEYAKDEASKSCMVEMENVAVKTEVYKEQISKSKTYPRLGHELSTFIDDMQTPMSLLPTLNGLMKRVMEDIFNWMKGNVMVPLMSETLNIMESILGLVTHVIDALAGLIPFAGAFISAAITSALAEVLKNVKKFCQNEGSGFIDTMLGGVRDAVNAGLDVMFSNSDKFADQFEGPASPMMVVLQKLGRSIAPDAGNILEDCNMYRTSQAKMMKRLAIAANVKLEKLNSTRTPAPTLPLPPAPILAGGCTIAPGMEGDATCPTGTTQLSRAECGSLPGSWIGKLEPSFYTSKPRKDAPSGCYIAGQLIYFNVDTVGGTLSDAQPLCKKCATPSPTPVPTPAPTSCGAALQHAAVSSVLTLNLSARASALRHAGEECFSACGNQSGMCDWCGVGNTCCRSDIDSASKICQVSVGAPVGNHACTKVAQEFMCPKDHVVTSLASVYSITMHDRSWKLGCSAIVGHTLTSCAWTEYSYLGANFTLNATKQLGLRFVVGMRTYYDHGVSDRTMQLRVCGVPGAQVNMVTSSSDWDNTPFEPLDVTLSNDVFLVGIESYRKRKNFKTADRGFKALTAQVCMQPPTFLRSAFFGGSRCATYSSDDPYARLQMLKCDPSSSGQKFYFDGSAVKSLLDDTKCLHYDTGTGALLLYECHTSENQQWYFDTNGRLKMKFDSKLCVDVDQGSLVDVIMHVCYDGASQLWSLSDKAPATPAPTAPSLFAELSAGETGEDCPQDYSLITEATTCKVYANEVSAVYDPSCESSNLGQHAAWCAERPLQCFKDSESGKIAFKGTGVDFAIDVATPVCKKADRVFVKGEEGQDSMSCPASSVSISSASTCAQYALSVSATYSSACDSFLEEEQDAMCSNKPSRCWQDTATKIVYFKGAGNDTADPTSSPICMKAAALELVTSYDDKCLDLDVENLKVQMLNCKGVSNQKWYFDDRRLKSMWNSQLCLDYGESNMVLMSECHTGKSQKWYFQGKQLKSYADDDCLDYDYGINGMKLSACHYEENQQFTFKGLEDEQAYIQAVEVDLVTKIAEGGDWTDVHCDNGQRIIGGGCEATQEPHVFQQNSPNGETVWRCGGYGGNKKTWALCSGTMAPVIKTKEGGDWVSVECDAGHKVIGGGCKAHGDKVYSRSAPVGDNKWECGGHGGDKKVWAICSPTIVPVMKWSEGSDWVTATCDSGYKAIGGGCSSESGNHQMSKSAPDGENAWHCGGHGTHKKVVVICKPDSR